MSSAARTPPGSRPRRRTFTWPTRRSAEIPVDNALTLTLSLESDIAGIDLFAGLPDLPTITISVDQLGTGFVTSIVSEITEFVLEDDASFVLSLVSDDPALNGTEIAVNLAASETANNDSLQNLVDQLNDALEDAFQDALGEARKVEAVIEAGKLKLQAVTGEGVGEFSVATSALNAAATALGFDHALPKISLPSNLDDLIGNLSLFDDIGFGEILAGLEQLSLFLSQFEAFGFLSDPLPLVDVSVNDLIGVAIRFNTAVEEARNNPAGTLQALEGKLKEALGLPSDSDFIDLSLIQDGAETLLGINLMLGADFSESVGIDFDLSSNSNPFSLAGGGELRAEGSAAISLGFGIDLTDPTQVFLLDSTGIEGDLLLSGNDLGFVASVGLPNAPDLPRLALAIAGGSAAIGGGVSVSLDDFFGGDSRRLLSDIIDDDGGLADGVIPVVEVEGFVDANLPVSFQGLDLGAITLAAGQADNPDTPEDEGVSLDFSSILDDLTVELPDFADLIDISQLGLFDSILLGVDGVDIFLSTLQDVLDGELLNIPLPLIGDQLADAARFIEDFRDNFVDPFRSAVETAQEFAEDAPTLVAELLFDVLESTGLLLVEVDGELVAATKERLGIDFVLEDAIRIDTNLDMDPSLQDSFAQWDFTLGQDPARPAGRYRPRPGHSGPGHRDRGRSGDRPGLAARSRLRHQLRRRLLLQHR